MAPATVIFICATVIAILEVSNLASKKDFLNKPVRVGIILLCLGLIVYFNIDRQNISGNEPTKEKTDTPENEVKILPPQIDTINHTVIKKSDSNGNNEAIIQRQKDSILSMQDKDNIIINKNARELTYPMKAEFQKDVRYYFSKYNLPANSPIDILCRMGDDNAYDFSEKLSDYLKSAGYTVNPILNKMQLRSKKITTLDMNLKDNRVEINVGSADISPANPIVVQ